MGTKNLHIMMLVVIFYSLNVSFALGENVFGEKSYFEITPSDRSQDELCISDEDVMHSPRINQLVSILKQNSTEMGLGYVTEQGNERTCFVLSKIPPSSRDTVVELTMLLQKPQRINVTKDISFTGAKVFGGQVIAMALLLYVAPTSFTRWGDKRSELIKNIPKSYKDAFTKPPVWDQDAWQANFVAHPYSGSIYYNALRSKNYSAVHSFLFATFESTVWEYFIESIFERPSVQDLVMTPIAGSLLGEGIHHLTVKMKKNGFSVGEKIIVTLLNPSYVLNNGYKK